MRIMDWIMEKLSHPSVPLRTHVDFAIYNLNTQLYRLDQAHSRLKQRDKEVFEKCVKAKMKKDNLRATLYAAEVVEIRKILRALNKTKIALEQTIARLRLSLNLERLYSAVKDIGRTMKEAQVKVEGAPLMVRSLREVSDLLSSVMPEAREVVVRPVEEAKAVLRQAATVAEEKVKAVFPAPPAVPEKELELEVGEKKEETSPE